MIVVSGHEKCYSVFARQERLELQLSSYTAVVCSVTAATLSICAIRGHKRSFPHSFPSSTIYLRSSPASLAHFHHRATAYLHRAHAFASLQGISHCCGNSGPVLTAFFPCLIACHCEPYALSPFPSRRNHGQRRSLQF